MWGNVGGVGELHLSDALCFECCSVDNVFNLAEM